MNIQKVTRFLAIALSAAALAGYGCGRDGGGGGATTTGTTTTGTTITGATQATSATGSGTQSAGVGSNSGQTLSNLAAVGGSCPGCAPQYRSPLAGKDKRFNKLHAAEVKAMRVPQMKKAAFLKKAKAFAAGKKASIPISLPAEPCTDGGTVAISGSVDDVTYAYTMTMTFVNCRDMDTESSGTITNSGTFSATTGGDTFTMKLGDADGVIEATDFKVREFTNNYTNLFAAYTADMTMTGSGDPTLDAQNNVTGYTFTFTGNGKEEYTDFIDTYTLEFTNLIFSSTSTGLLTTVASGSDTINGTFKESWTEGATANSVALTFGDADTAAEVTTNTTPDFTIAWETDWATYYKFSVDGQVATDYTTPSDADCLDGTFLIDTTTPINENLSTGLTTAGQMTINTNTTVTFNADGTVTVTVSGQTPVSYTSQNALEAVCPIEDMEQDTSSEQTFDNTTTTTTTTSGTTLLATLSWTGTGCPTTGCTSDMDLHLAHYATAPTSTTAVTDWEIYFSNDDPSTVLPNDDTSTPIVTNATGDTVGGIEGNLDYDDTEGDGPEHITIESLPTGYYVLYVDSYSLDQDTGATVTVSLNIGGNLYTFPTHAFSSTATTSYRVVDISVDSSGTVTLLTPDTTNFPALYYPAPGARPAKARR